MEKMWNLSEDKLMVAAGGQWVGGVTSGAEGIPFSPLLFCPLLIYMMAEPGGAPIHSQVLGEARSEMEFTV